MIFKKIKQLFCKHKYQGTIFTYKHCKKCGKSLPDDIWEIVEKYYKFINSAEPKGD